MQFIPTNDCFHHILLLLRIHKNKDRDFIIELFASRGRDVSKSQIKSWQTKTGQQKTGYREMPREALDDFIEALHDAELIKYD